MTTITPETTDERIAARLAAFTKQQAALPQPGALPLSTTHYEAAAIDKQRGVLAGRIATIHRAADALARLDVGAGAADACWLQQLHTWRATLGANLLALTSPNRDRALRDRADGLTFSIKLIDHGLGAVTIGSIVSLSSLPIGHLMHEAGYVTEGPELQGPTGWRGSVKEVEQRLKAFAQRRADVLAALDEALLDDGARTQRDAEDAMQRDALHSMRIKRDRTGEGFVVFTKDGEPLDVADMTAVQRKAFERFEAANRSPVTT